MSWERVRHLFQAAIEQSQERRDAFLSAACDRDEELRREVLSLLAAHTAAGGFLETPAVRLLAYTLYLVLDAGEHAALAPFSAAMAWFVLPLTGLTLAVVAWRASGRGMCATP